MISGLYSNLQEIATAHVLRTCLTITLSAPLILILWTEYWRCKARLRGFPGPTGLPVIGNIYDIRINAAEQYRKWSKKFGPVFQIQLGNIPVLVVNSAASAKEIFGNHAQALSSRPVFYTFHKVDAVCHSVLQDKADQVGSKGGQQHCRYDDWHFPILRVS